MRRLPVYFLVDVSDSMVGTPIEQVASGMQAIINELRTDPYALETVYVSVIIFAGKAITLLPLTELCSLKMPSLPIGSGTSLGQGLETLMNEMSSSIVQTTVEVKGDWKPIVFVFTDGVPTDKPEQAIKQWENKWRSHCNVVAVSLGNNADLSTLGRITENVMRLNEMKKESFMTFFKWVTASIKATSVSIAEYNSDESMLPKPDGIILEKIDNFEKTKHDENCVILLARCSVKKKPYLIKYLRNYQSEDSNPEFDFDGTYPIDGESYENLSLKIKTNSTINNNQLFGEQVKCPFCDNEFGDSICSCGGILCSGKHDKEVTCPWCNATLEMETVDSLDYNREIG